MAGGGALTVETRRVQLGEPARPEQPPAGDYVMIAVADTGSGMSPQVLARAFEPFFTTKGVGRGSGLGLSQVLGLAKQSGGGVEIETAPGRGTAVRLYLPPSAEPAAEDHARPAPPEAAGRGLTVLLVDDDALVREVTAAALHDLGYAVLEADGGPSALDLLRAGAKVDLALLDFAMPGQNGADLAREAQRLRPALPILFVTGYADTAVLGDTPESQIVRKPFRGEDLAAKLATAVMTPKPESLKRAP